MLPGLRLYVFRTVSSGEGEGPADGERMHCIVTVTLDKTESIVIHLTDKSLDKMQEWCIKQQGE